MHTFNQVMTDRTSLTLTPNRRRLEDQLRHMLADELPDTQFRTTLYDMALTHLIESIENHNEFDGDPRIQKQFATSVVRPKYRTHLEFQRP